MNPPRIVRLSLWILLAVPLGNASGDESTAAPWLDSFYPVAVALAQASGVSPEVEATGPGASEVEVRRWTNERVQFLFAFNHANAPANASLAVRVPWPLEGVRNLTDDRMVPFREVGGGLIFQKKPAAGEIWALRLQRR